MRVGRYCAVFVAMCVGACATSRAAAQSPELLKARGTQNRAETNLSQRPVPPPNRTRVSSPEVFYCETPDTSCRTTQDTFSPTALRDLFVFVVWPGISGQHIQTVQFLLPDGSLYSEEKTSFTIGAASSGPLVTLQTRREVSPPAPAPHLIADGNKLHSEGIPRLLTASRNEPAVLTVLPVGGTYITQRNLSGIWRVRVLLDGQPAVESTFTFTPPAPAASAEEGDSQ